MKHSSVEEWQTKGKHSTVAGKMTRATIGNDQQKLISSIDLPAIPVAHV